jgi:hypothetical protein
MFKEAKGVLDVPPCRVVVPATKRLSLNAYQINCLFIPHSLYKKTLLMRKRLVLIGKDDAIILVQIDYDASMHRIGSLLYRKN